MRQRGWRMLVKRALDVSLALPALALATPALCATGLAVLVTMGPPIVFTQERPGRHGKIFKIHKFRTMTDERGVTGELLADELRLTRVGRIVRATSLDELPQLWNVVKGEMSLVGPRPLLVRYLPRYSHEQARRHDVLPGITGWAQINGRNALSWPEKFAHDVWYVDNWGLWLDVRIIAATVVRVLRREGVANAGSATMPEFMG